MPESLSINTSVVRRQRMYGSSPSPNDLSTLQSASQIILTAKHLLLQSSFTPLSTQFQSQKYTYRTALTFRVCYTERLEKLRASVLDSNGDLIPFEKRTQLSHPGAKENTWDNGLWDNDVFCVLREIQELESIIQQLEHVCPEGK